VGKKMEADDVGRVRRSSVELSTPRSEEKNEMRGVVDS
jgi:hypothetical protein